MATLLQQQDIDCQVIDEENAVLRVKQEKYILDYPTLMDFLTRLAVNASIMENQEESRSLSH